MQTNEMIWKFRNYNRSRSSIYANGVGADRNLHDSLACDNDHQQPPTITAIICLQKGSI